MKIKKPVAWNPLLAVAAVWVGLVASFAVGRVIYLADHFSTLAAEPFAGSELVLALLSALRFDASVSAYAVLPVYVAAMVLILARRLQRWFPSFVAAWGILMAAAAWTAIVVDHYYFLYFKDHFNTFLWEFFDDPSNAALVADGVFDLVPIPAAAAFWAIGLGTFAAWIVRICRRLGKHAVDAVPVVRPLVLVPGTLLLLIAARGTFDRRPLPIQDRRVTISRNSFINLLHSNPIFALHRSRQEVENSSMSSYRQALASTDVSRDFAAIEAMLPGARHETDAKGLHYFAQTVRPEWAEFFVRRPRHVVLIVMESFARWPMEIPENDLGKDLGRNFLHLKQQGLSFSRHFSTGKGTLKNLINIFFPFPLPRDFHPSLNYHRESRKAFPNLTPRVFGGLGFDTAFLYGGTASWHRLYSFVPMIGFGRFLAEHSAPGLPHHEHGLFDDGTFEMLHQVMQSAERDTFAMVMTLSNHPPFIVPAEDAQPKVALPQTVHGKPIGDPAAMGERFAAFRYADRALGRYFEKAAKAEYFKDTVFILTADHSFHDGIDFGLDFDWRLESIPFLVYAPAIMKPTYQGSSQDTFTTHFDILPTALSLILKEEATIQTWGRSALAKGGKPATGFTQYLSCLDGTCLLRDRLFRLGREAMLLPVDDAAESRGLAAKLRSLQDSYYRTGMHFLDQFQ